MILIYGNEQAWSKMPPEDAQRSFTAFMEYNQKMVQAGVLRQGEQLQPSRTARTLRVANGKVVATDGPYAESKEQLGGYYIIEVAGEEEAVMWGSQCPAIFGGAIEVRPVLPVTRQA